MDIRLTAKLIPTKDIFRGVFGGPFRDIPGPRKCKSIQRMLKREQVEAMVEVARKPALDEAQSIWWEQ